MSMRLGMVAPLRALVVQGFDFRVVSFLVLLPMGRLAVLEGSFSRHLSNAARSLRLLPENESWEDLCVRHWAEFAKQALDNEWPTPRRANVTELEELTANALDQPHTLLAWAKWNKDPELGPALQRLCPAKHHAGAFVPYHLATMAAIAISKHATEPPLSPMTKALQQGIRSGDIRFASHSLSFEVADAFARVLGLVCDGLPEGLTDLFAYIDSNPGGPADSAFAAFLDCNPGLSNHPAFSHLLQRLPVTSMASYQAAIDKVFQSAHSLEARKELLTSDIDYDGPLPVRYSLATMLGYFYEFCQTSLRQWAKPVAAVSS